MSFERPSFERKADAADDGVPEGFDLAIPKEKFDLEHVVDMSELRLESVSEDAKNQQDKKKKNEPPAPWLDKPVGGLAEEEFGKDDARKNGEKPPTYH